MIEDSAELEKQQEREKAKAALEYIMPLLEKNHLRWCISGSLALQLYGVNRPIEAIDIDVESSRDNPEFQALLKEVEDHVELPFQLWKDKNYDNWVTDVVVGGQLLSICDTADLKMFNSQGEAVLFYPEGKIPDPVMVEFEGLQLPLAPKESVLRMRKALAHKKPSEEHDISEMERIINEPT
jgi:hypothetical protein